MGNIENIIRRALGKDKFWIAKLISLIESKPEILLEYGDLIWNNVGKAHIIGFTGISGAGKSTLISLLVKLMRAQGKYVGIISIDPSSPYSGGAVLGDRVRIQKSINSGIYMRSVTAPPEEVIPWKALVALEVLDAAGFDYIILETVGAAQSNVDIASIADTVIVVIVPGTGDDVQALKAGLMEIGDIYVVSKGDKPEAEVTFMQVKAVIEGMKKNNWDAPIILTSALMNKGIKDLYAKIHEHYKFILDKGLIKLKREKRFMKELEIITLELLKRKLNEYLEEDATAKELVSKVRKKEVNPFKAAYQLVKVIAK